MTRKTVIEPSDVMDMDSYAEKRAATRTAMIEAKKDRRQAVGPNMMLYFENYDTMLYQVHEMMFSERGGDEQLAEELQSYNPLIPNGGELVATMMLEYPDANQRAKALAQLGGIEEFITIEFDGEIVKATWEDDVERTTPDGKTSSVHFLHFPFTPSQIEKFRQTDVRVSVAVGHDNYGHMAIMPDRVRTALAGDFAE